MSSVALAIMTYPGGNDAVQRHLPYWQRQEADWTFLITTEARGCRCPPELTEIVVGENRYIDGDHLPKRLLDTLSELLKLPWNIAIICEYDTLFCKRINIEAMEHGVAAHLAGGQTWGSKAKAFYHNPHVFQREAAIKFEELGRELLSVCPPRQRGQPDVPEASPDVFFGYVIQEGGFPIQTDLWKEYSKNDLKVPEHLEAARQAYRDGYEIVHGCKSAEELTYITT